MWCYTLNKKSTLKNTGKWKHAGRVMEICQSKKVGTMKVT